MAAVCLTSIAEPTVTTFASDTGAILDSGGGCSEFVCVCEIHGVRLISTAFTIFLPIVTQPTGAFDI